MNNVDFDCSVQLPKKPDIIYKRGSYTSLYCFRLFAHFRVPGTMSNKNHLPKNLNSFRFVSFQQQRCGGKLNVKLLLIFGCSDKRVDIRFVSYGTVFLLP